EWLRSSLERSSFAPQININISADGFMAQIKSVIITPVFKNEWSSAYTSYSVGTWVNVPAPVAPPIVTPPVVVPPPVSVPIAANGRINVTSNPSGARVFLNGVEQASTPANFTGLEYGEYEITVIYPGYRTFTRTVNVSGSGVQYVYADLTAIRKSASGNSIFAKQIDLSWPSVGPFMESFSYAGYYWTVTLKADSILGMLTKVYATASVQGGSQVQFAELAPSGVNAAYRSKVVEYANRPFTFRLTVLDVKNSTGSLTGTSYIESIRLYLEVLYIG
ncbi:MAG TPA: PEGA domain-containing protein, partial [Bacillota bacterium]|nr:PEGA domain-containing protein [Bacillota bacterium]